MRRTDNRLWSAERGGGRCAADSRCHPRWAAVSRPAVALGPLAIDMPVAGLNVTTLTMPGNALSVSGGEVIGNLGVGVFNQSGGTHTISSVDLVLGNAASGIGNYNLSGTGTVAATI